MYKLLAVAGLERYRTFLAASLLFEIVLEIFQLVYRLATVTFHTHTKDRHLEELDAVELD